VNTDQSYQKSRRRSSMAIITCFEVTDAQRKAIAALYGGHGMADREQVREFIHTHVVQTMALLELPLMGRG
jgi:hypothetical protein